MENLDLISFRIISFVGVAKSKYLEAVKKAEEGDFEKAERFIVDGDNEFNKGHEVHAKLIAEEAKGNRTIPTILLMHAEDQLLSAETIKIMALQMIKMYKQMNELKKEDLNDEKGLSVL